MTTVVSNPPRQGIPTGPPSVARPSLLTLTGVELRKLADTRAGRWLLIVIGLASAAITTVQLFALSDAEQTFATFFTAAIVPSSLLLPVLGILSVTSEWSQRTALTTFALVPLRHRVAAAKLAAGVLIALLAVLVALAVAAISNLVGIASGGDGSWTVKAVVIGEAAVLETTYMLMGIAFGMLLLNTPLAIVLFFLLPLVWSILGGMISRLQDVAGWLDMGVTTASMTTGEMTSGQWGRFLVSAAVWVLLPLVAGFVRLTHRELS